MNQQIRFCTAPDGVRIAYATVGKGPPLVKVSNWLSHLEFDWHSPVWRYWLEELSKHHTFIRYDMRGCGLSDWNVEDLSLDARVQDLEMVVDALELSRFALLALSGGGSIAIAYAVRHPDKISHLVLYGCYSRGWFKRNPTPRQIEEAETLLQVMKIGWGKANPAFRQIFTTLFIPEGSPEQIDWFNDLQRISTSSDIAARLESTAYTIDVSHLASQVSVPTLVLHAEEDAVVPFEEGRRLATLIPGARFVPLASKNHLLLESEPAWQRFLEEMSRFLDVPTGGVRVGRVEETQQHLVTLTRREREIASLVAQGQSNHQIADGLVISERTVEGHISNILAKLNFQSRAQVAAWVVQEEQRR